MEEYSEEFKYWYERIFLQSPSMCQLQYDDEKMWEAWKASRKEIENDTRSKGKKASKKDIR